MSAIVLAALLVALSACSSTSNALTVQASEDFAGAPEEAGAPKEGAPAAGDADQTDRVVWLEDGESIGVVLYGSATCPRKATTMTVPGRFLEASVAVAPTKTKGCSTDRAAHTTVFRAPALFRENSSDIMVQLPSGKVALTRGGPH